MDHIPQRIPRIFYSSPIFTKGLRENKFTILDLEAPVWQGAKTQEYLAIFRAFATQPGGMHRRIKQVRCIGV